MRNRIKLLSLTVSAFSCLALGAFGVGISVVLGLQEIVAALRRKGRREKETQGT